MMLRAIYCVCFNVLNGSQQTVSVAPWRGFRRDELLEKTFYGIFLMFNPHLKDMFFYFFNSNIAGIIMLLLLELLQLSLMVAVKPIPTSFWS